MRTCAPFRCAAFTQTDAELLGGFLSIVAVAISTVRAMGAEKNRKARFDSLLVYRDLDGEVSADLREESVCLLRRARWLPATRKDMAWENDFAISAALEAEMRDFPTSGSAYRDDHFDAYADEEERYMSGRRSGDFRGRNKNAGRDRSRPVVVLVQDNEAPAGLLYHGYAVRPLRQPEDDVGVRLAADDFYARVRREALI